MNGEASFTTRLFFSKSKSRSMKPSKVSSSIASSSRSLAERSSIKSHGIDNDDCDDGPTHDKPQLFLSQAHTE